MTEIELAWLAGLLEGEGCFSLRKDRNFPVIDVKMTDLDVINRVAMLMGRAVTPIPARVDGWQVQYRARLQGEPARELMRALLPHMGQRRAARIKELLETAVGRPR
jgi:hypothetical protein